MMTYLSGLELPCPVKYRDMLLDTGMEEVAPVEMLVTVITRLHSTSPVETHEERQGLRHGAVIGATRVEDAILAGLNPQHSIVSRMGAIPTDSVGYSWNPRYMDCIREGCRPPAADITRQQFNVSVLVGHKPIPKPVLEPFCLCRLSGRNGGQFTFDKQPTHQVPKSSSSGGVPADVAADLYLETIDRPIAAAELVRSW